MPWLQARFERFYTGLAPPWRRDAAASGRAASLEFCDAAPLLAASAGLSLLKALWFFGSMPCAPTDPGLSAVELCCNAAAFSVWEADNAWSSRTREASTPDWPI